MGWSRTRRAIVLRRRLKDAVGLRLSDEDGPPQLAFVEIGEATEVYEYSVLVTSLDEETVAFGQLYRDRGDGENIFDEMKNQWGWGGYPRTISPVAGSPPGCSRSFTTGGTSSSASLTPASTARRSPAGRCS